MKFKVEGTQNIKEASIATSTRLSEYNIEIDGKEKNLKILKITGNKLEFLLDQQYHVARYLENSTGKISIFIDGVKITLNKHPDLDEIVYKHAGGAKAESEAALKSQIPGKVNSIEVKEGDQVKEGDVICVLESMKMQISVKSHREGTVKSIRVKQGKSIGRGDLIAEIE